MGRSVGVTGGLGRGFFSCGSLQFREQRSVTIVQDQQYINGWTQGGTSNTVCC
jgi:hypothetical protein